MVPSMMSQKNGFQLPFVCELRLYSVTTYCGYPFKFLHSSNNFQTPTDSIIRLVKQENNGFLLDRNQKQQQSRDRNKTSRTDHFDSNWPIHSDTHEKTHSSAPTALICHIKAFLI